MSDMVRKQVYIFKRQEALIKRLSEARGISEAEIIRWAIENELGGRAARPVYIQGRQTTSALDEFIQLARQQDRAGLTGAPYQWNRAEIYAECEGE